MSTSTPHLFALISGSNPLAIRRYSFASSSSPDFFASSAAVLNILCRSNNTANCLSCRVANVVLVCEILGDIAVLGPAVGGCNAEGFSGVMIVDSEAAPLPDWVWDAKELSVSSAFRGAPGISGYHMNNKFPVHSMHDSCYSNLYKIPGGSGSSSNGIGFPSL